MISQTEENYLKAIFALADAHGEVIVTELSKKLDVKIPTANSMVKRLSDKGLVVYESYKPIRLTENGKIEAALIVRKHRLTEMYLVEKMGFGWEEVHDIAEQVEHIQSPLFFQKMDELLGYPKVDPHGSPIPDIHGKLIAESYSKLSDCSVGDRVELMAVAHSSEELLKFLNSRRLTLGAAIVVESVESYDGSMSVSYGMEKHVALSKVVSDKLLVSPTKSLP